MPDFIRDSAVAFIAWEIIFFVVWHFAWVVTWRFEVSPDDALPSMRPVGGVWWFAIGLYWSLVPGILEEVYLRGLLKTYFDLRIQKRYVLYTVVSGLLFGLGHFAGGITKVVAMCFVGSVFAWLFLKMRTVWPLITAHVAANLYYFFIQSQ